MAGKRMKLKMDMPIFSMSPVDRKVLGNWALVIDMEALQTALKKEIQTATAQTVWFDFVDHRQVGSVVEIVNQMILGLPLLLRTRKGEFAFHGFPIDGVREATVNDAAQSTIDPGLWLLMILNTWRSMITQLSGPAIGFDFNITIAGIVATCLRLGVDVQFESA